MTRFYISSLDLDKWIHQNRAEYDGLFEEGCLLDNFVVNTKRGVAAIYEHFVNTGTSDYYVEFQSYKENAVSDIVMKNWFDFERRVVNDES